MYLSVRTFIFSFALVEIASCFIAFLYKISNSFCLCSLLRG